MGLKKNIMVGISDVKVSRSVDEVIVTYSLGSCIGVCLYDVRLKIGGMLHFQLPESKLDMERSRLRPCMFADSGLAYLLQEMKNNGSSLLGLQAKIAGGASMQNGPSNFEIGKRNCLAIRKALWKAGIMLAADDVGGGNARTLYLDIETGQVSIKSAGVIRGL